MVELVRLEMTLIVCSVDAVTELGGEYCTVYAPPPPVPAIDPSEPQTPLLQMEELETPAVSVSLGSSSVTAIFNMTAAPPAVMVVVVGEMLTTGPGAGEIAKVSESETPVPFAAVTVTVTEFGFGGTGGARYIAVVPFSTNVPCPVSDSVTPIFWSCCTLAIN